MVMDGNYACCGDHLAVYTNIEWLFCTPEYNVTCGLYLNKKVQLTNKSLEQNSFINWVLPTIHVLFETFTAYYDSNLLARLFC